MSKPVIKTVKEYNDSMGSQICMKFQNEDGSLKETGHVVSYMGNHRWVSSKSGARTLALTWEMEFKRGNPNWADAL
jgi:hypothetical protein